jgi:ribosome biogenesis GTPase / thiamine phosphate phosphatase
MIGTVVKAQSGFFWVETEGETLRCVLRGRLKRSRVPGDIATLGDSVRVTPTIPGEGAIEEVLPRRSKLARRSAGSKGAWREDIIVANLDLLVTVFAVANPSPHVRMLDRYLVAAERSDLGVLIVANKSDRLPREEAEAIFSPYTRVGYDVLYTSAKQGMGVDELRERLSGKISAFSGPSGVGKSSLLNAIQPGLQLRTSDISDTVDKGRHTTVAPELIPLHGGGWVADTPGIRELGLWQVPPEELDWCYREFRPFIEQCYFQPCSHTHEPDCAVQEAVQHGAIDRQRYESYVRLREELSDATVSY